jgi:hypothetical protein
VFEDIGNDVLRNVYDQRDGTSGPQLNLDLGERSKAV